MNKKIILICLLGTVALQEKIYGDNFGGGFATGAILGTGITLAATSASRAPRDPYYAVEQAKAQQELREMRAQDRMRREEDRQERIQQREEARKEREHQRHLKQKQREKERNQEKKQSKNKEIPKYNTQQKPTKAKQNHNQLLIQQQQIHDQSPQDLQLEIKKLELEIAQLKFNKHHVKSSQSTAAVA